MQIDFNYDEDDGGHDNDEDTHCWPCWGSRQIMKIDNNYDDDDDGDDNDEDTHSWLC